ncbi:arabinogalactan oligomer/maltooligosaccharide transport system permease protein [Mycoplasmopsis mustelae]|uniref:Arabinogalactan oligomer/maltooligosaccharide transport system permease protein n=2 Tax=Mycoplasmopsis TaxID=2767358 RepID=A0A4R7UCR1_9BACT|nr:ABC transporter permease subunit [Mycoplasmopsis mustelae]TDV24217.1 arabinogalactan oligomer/maltooligosaccharide transport system permease protein [Mycoplasmopsis mustelae]
MEKLKLYNWYGESFDAILPQTSGNLKAYKKQVKNIFLRTKDKINAQTNIDKDLFLRARSKLNANLKRQLNSHYVAYKNKISVLRDSIKKLSFCENINSLLNFELKKIQKNLKDIRVYAKDYVYSLSKSADELEVKIAHIKKLQNSTRLSETETFKKYIIFSVLKIYLNKIKDTDFELTKIHQFLLPNELSYLQKLGDKANIFFKTFYQSIEQQRLSLVARKNELQRKYSSTYKLQKELYLKEKENIILNTKQKILEIEYEYTNKAADLKQRAKQQKQLSLFKIEEQKQNILSKEANNKAIVDKIKNKSKIEVKHLYYQYQHQKSFYKQRAILQNYKDLYLFLSKNQLNLPNFDFTIKNLNTSKLKLKNQEIWNSLKEFQKQNASALVDIAFQTYLNLINQKRNNYEFNLLLKSQYKHLLSKSKSSYTYEGDFLSAESKALKEKFIDNRTTRLKFCEERIKSKVALFNFKHLTVKQLQALSKEYNREINLANINKIKHEIIIQQLQILENQHKDNLANLNLQLEQKLITTDDFNDAKLNLENQLLLDKTYLVNKFNTVYANEKAEIKVKYKNIKEVYKQNIKKLKAKIKTKEITKAAFKNKKIEVKIEYKESKIETKLQSKILSNKEILKTSFWRELAEMKVNSKIYDSKITEAQKTIPTETMKNLRWLSLILGIVLPGLPEITMFKQYLKGAIMLFVSVLVWALIIPFSFGYYWNKMGGIPGFGDLGANSHNIDLGELPDARIYLFGGVISVILMVLVLIYFITSGMVAYRVARNLEFGSRPSKWSHTKRWLKTGGYPWIISILGWILMIFVVATPIITSILISFTNYGYQHSAPAQTVDWVGLKNWGYWWTFRKAGLFQSLGRVFYWTAIWTVFSTFLPISLGIIIAILTNNQRIKFKKFFRLIYILPWAIPAFVTLSFLRSSFAPGEVGYINKILLELKLINNPINWLNQISSARILVIVVQTWIGYAFIFMLVTGNLQSIPKDIYEAGSVDGAKGRQLFWYLTLPSLLISIAPMLIGQFVGAFNNFTTISIFTGGGPNFENSSAFGEASTDIIISWVYKITSNAIQVEGNQAFAAALTTFAALISIAIGARGFIKTMSRRD